MHFRVPWLIRRYFETDADTFKEACERMEQGKAGEVSTRWQKGMTKYVVANELPLLAAQELEHYFYCGSDQR